MTIEKAKMDLWLKDITPSTELRKWFGHASDKWKGFKKRHHQEPKENKERVSFLKEQMKKGVVTLFYGAKDEEHNETLVINEFIQR